MTLTIKNHNALFSTAPQALPDDMAQIAALGFKTVICNRPDFEGGADQPTIESVSLAAKAEGLNFIAQPFSGAQMDDAVVIAFANLVSEAEKPILAYCRTGTRCTNVFHAAVQMGYLDAQTLVLLS